MPFKSIRFAVAALLLGAPALLCANFGVEPVSPSAYVLFKVGDIPVTNSMVTTWFFVLLFVLGLRLFIGRKPSLVPNRRQALAESVMEGIYGALEPVVGKKLAPKTFPLLFALFVFILIVNWSSLLPGVGTVGLYQGRHLNYFFRPASSDLNTTAALALVAICGWVYFALRYTGVKALAHELFANKADKKEVPYLIYLFLGFIFLGVGCIEIVSYLFRPVSLAFRLFGNVFGGENLLSYMFGMVSLEARPVLQAVLRCLCALPFYFLELLIGLIQAFVFVLLTAVYIGLNCNHEEEGEPAPSALAEEKPQSAKEGQHL